jgi:hypothetical protein
MRQGCAAGGWVFVALLAVAVFFTVLTGVCGILVVVNYPPPVGFWMLMGVYALAELWRWRMLANEGLDTADDCRECAAADLAQFAWTCPGCGACNADGETGRHPDGVNVSGGD